MDIKIDCVGDSNYAINSDEEDFASFDGHNHYKLRELPGSIAIVVIKVGQLKTTLNFNVEQLKLSALKKFISDVRNNESSQIDFNSDSNQFSGFEYNKGEIIFTHNGPHGSADFEVKVPAIIALTALERLI